MKKILLVMCVMLSVSVMAQFDTGTGSSVTQAEADEWIDESQDFNDSSWPNYYDLEEEYVDNLLGQEGAVGIGAWNVLTNTDSTSNLVVYAYDSEGDSLTEYIYSTEDGGTSLSTSEAADQIANFDGFYPMWRCAIFMGADHYSDLQSQSGVEGIRYYNGMDSTEWETASPQHFILMAYNSSGSDITGETYSRKQMGNMYAQTRRRNQPVKGKLDPPN